MDGGSWNWLATAPLSRLKSVSPVTGFHGSSEYPDNSRTCSEASLIRSSLRLDSTPYSARRVSATSPRFAFPARSPMPLIVPWIHVAPDLTAATADGFGRRDPERVDDADLAGAGLDRARVDTVVELGVGTRGVDAEEGGVDAVLGGERHRRRDPAEHRLARNAKSLELEVGDRRLDHRRSNAELDERLQVGRNGAGESPDLRPEAGIGDQLHRVPVVLRDAREAGLDPVDPELVERPGDLELLHGVEDDADRLLAVAEGGVVQADGPTEPMLVVQRPRPDHPALTIPSGKGESFSGPSAVTRKLSSTRRPPPPSQ